MNTTTNEMTIGEMMLHFRISQEHYYVFAKWVNNNAHKLELISPNNVRKNGKLYLVDKVERLFPNKELFNTLTVNDEVQAAAELLSGAMFEHTGKRFTADEIIKKLDTYDTRRVFLSAVQNYVVEIIKWHDMTLEQQRQSQEHRLSCWSAVRRVNWLTVAYLVVLIVNIAISIWL